MDKILNNKTKRMILCMLVILSMFVVLPVLQLFLEDIGIKNEIFNSIISMILYSGCLVLIFFSELKEDFKNFKKNIGKCVDTGFKYWLLGLVIMVVSNLIINFIVFKGGIAANEEINRQAITSNPFWYTFIASVMIGPFIEELVFRKSLDKVFVNPIFYFLASGLLFGFAHTLADLSSPLYLLYIIPYGALGYVFAMMSYKTKSVFTSIMMHSLHNLITCLLIVFVV